ncbi:MAG TPA: hypothetical protein VM470_10120, partial [Acidimicrobiia bacterium]|nr:hypothetical protein [Acidimicrobiia bacterium]
MRPLIVWMAMAAMACGSGSDLIEFASATPNDVRQLTRAAVVDFLEAFPTKGECLQGLRLQVDPSLDDRGHYDPTAATITLRTPATASKLRNSLFHEIAHHLEWKCPSQIEMRQPFLIAQGFPVDSEWAPDDSWETSPSEHFAEAVVEVIEGRRNLTYGVSLSD